MSQDSKLDEMVGEMKQLADLQAYSDAQYKTIIDLNKQINKLKEEKSHLEKLLPAVSDSSKAIVQFAKFTISDEEEICLTQLKILNDISKRGSLTLEECRKMAEYVKTLHIIKGNPKDIEHSSKNIPTEELLKIAGGLVENGK